MPPPETFPDFTGLLAEPLEFYSAEIARAVAWPESSSGLRPIATISPATQNLAATGPNELRSADRFFMVRWVVGRGFKLLGFVWIVLFPGRAGAGGLGRAAVACRKQQPSISQCTCEYQRRQRRAKDETVIQN